MTYTDNGTGADVAIGGLPFKLAVSKDNPYERATAQFRKDQFDAAPTVGDQSLTGWWTRGQLSFHRGAGVKYYEVLDGADVLNRFQKSSAIDPWGPGEVTLSGALSSVTLANVADAVGSLYGGAAGVDALVSGDLSHVTSSVISTRHTSDYTDITSITTSGSLTYAVTPSAIFGPAATSHLMSTNHILNPRFHASGDTSQVTRYDQANPGDMTTPVYANGALTFTVSSTFDMHGVHIALTGLTNGATYRFRVDNDATSKAFNVWKGAAPHLGGVNFGSVPAGAVTEFSVTASSASVDLYLTATLSGAHKINSLAFTTEVLAAPPGFNPVDNSDYVWTGSANASVSTRTVAVGDLYPLWLPVSGRTWASAWWAKGRFFALDSAGKFHTLSTVGGTATDAANLFWNPALGIVGWSVAESPGAVYIAHGTDIYKVVPDSSGAIPVITTPVVAASLPTGEAISTIYAYLGRMVICTNQGLRVAIIDPDSGALVYGPRLVDGDFSGCVRVTALGDLAYVTGTPTGAANPSIYAVNMADNKDLEPAWAEVRPVSTGTLFGATATPDGKIMSWDGSGFYRTATGYVTSGYVETGFHRLGTLEQKSFQFLRVKTEGTAGSVLVEAILPNGNTTTVGTVAAGDSVELSLSTAVPDPQEYIALKFTLTGPGTSSPILLGYQLKALPAPTRQRMIRLPLLCQDVERRGGAPASGYVGSAWDRLKALEDMEANGATFDYQDFRTGETGKVFVETVEHRGTTPPGDNSTGYGGIVFVTLRKLS